MRLQSTVRGVMLSVGFSRVLPSVRFSSRFRQLNLLLALGKALFLGIAGFVMAFRARHANHVQLALFIVLVDGTAARMTLIVMTRIQIVIYRNALIEHETLTFPERVFFRHIFQVLKNAAFKVVNLIKALLF